KRRTVPPRRPAAVRRHLARTVEQGEIGFILRQHRQEIGEGGEDRETHAPAVAVLRPEQRHLAVRRSASGNPGGMETREKSGDAQNSASAAARWTRRSGRSRSFTPSASSPPTWSMCKWVSTTSVTDARSMPAASSRRAHCPARGKFKFGSAPSPHSLNLLRSPLPPP